MPAKILVVEDHADARQMLAAILESEGYTAICAEDGLQGFSVARVERPDLILTDIGMPNLNGIEMTKLLREQEEFSNVPILVLTAYHKGVMIEAIKAGATGATSKPVQLESLLRLVKNLLAGASSLFLLITTLLNIGIA
jgi:DNA-binding response OmpR family regulator